MLELQKIFKRLFDIIVSLSVLIIFLPVWLLIAIAVKVTSKGPVFFIQDRPGFHAKIFKIYKFRTMKIGSDKMIRGKEVMLSDSRITPIGKFLRRCKIDEIPQLLNILKGNMSIVGPRPERVDSLEHYTEEISRRLNVKPGLTGLAQVSGNIYLSLDDRYKLDVHYVNNLSFGLDFQIILRTVGVVLRGENKYIDKCLVDINKDVTLSSITYAKSH